MRLREIFESCQYDRLGEWVKRPGVYTATNVVVESETSLSDIVAAPLRAIHTAVNRGAGEVQLAWGVDARSDVDSADWWVPALSSHSRVEMGQAYILLNGAPVWHVDTSLIYWGGGEYETIVTPRGTPAKLKLTPWEKSFGQLLTSLGETTGGRSMISTLEDHAGLTVEWDDSELSSVMATSRDW